MNPFSTQKNKKAPLGLLACIRAGHNFRGRIEPTPSGNAWVVQTKDIASDGRLDVTDLTLVELEDLKEGHFLRENDILLRPRGGGNFPAAIVPNLSIKVLAAFPILLLRVEVQTVLPEYLAWQLNQPKTQNLLQALAQSTFVPTLSKSSLLDIPIALPPLDVQRQVVDFSKLAQTENRLLQEISTKRQGLADRLLLRYAESGKPSLEIAQLFRSLVSNSQI